MELEQEQELMLEISRMKADIREIQATLDVLVNYTQVWIEERGLREKCRKLEEQLDEIRARKTKE